MILGYHRSVTVLGFKGQRSRSQGQWVYFAYTRTLHRRTAIHRHSLGGITSCLRFRGCLLRASLTFARRRNQSSAWVELGIECLLVVVVVVVVECCCWQCMQVAWRSTDQPSSSYTSSASLASTSTIYRRLVRLDKSSSRPAATSTLMPISYRTSFHTKRHDNTVEMQARPCVLTELRRN